MDLETVYDRSKFEHLLDGSIVLKAPYIHQIFAVPGYSQNELPNLPNIFIQSARSHEVLKWIFGDTLFAISSKCYMDSLIYNIDQLKATVQKELPRDRGLFFRKNRRFPHSWENLQHLLIKWCLNEGELKQYLLQLLPHFDSFSKTMVKAMKNWKEDQPFPLKKFGFAREYLRQITLTSGCYEDNEVILEAIQYCMDTFITILVLQCLRRLDIHVQIHAGAVYYNLGDFNKQLEDSLRKKHITEKKKLQKAHKSSHCSSQPLLEPTNDPVIDVVGTTAQNSPQQGMDQILLATAENIYDHSSSQSHVAHLLLPESSSLNQPQTVKWTSLGFPQRNKIFDIVSSTNKFKRLRDGNPKTTHPYIQIVNERDCDMDFSSRSSKYQSQSSQLDETHCDQSFGEGNGPRKTVIDPTSQASISSQQVELPQQNCHTVLSPSQFSIHPSEVPLQAPIFTSHQTQFSAIKLSESSHLSSLKTFTDVNSHNINRYNNNDEKNSPRRRTVESSESPEYKKSRREETIEQSQTEHEQTPSSMDGTEVNSHDEINVIDSPDRITLNATPTFLEESIISTFDDEENSSSVLPAQKLDKADELVDVPSGTDKDNLSHQEEPSEPNTYATIKAAIMARRSELSNFLKEMVNPFDTVKTEVLGRLANQEKQHQQEMDKILEIFRKSSEEEDKLRQQLDDCWNKIRSLKEQFNQLSEENQQLQTDLETSKQEVEIQKKFNEDYQQLYLLEMVKFQGQVQSLQQNLNEKSVIEKTLLEEKRSLEGKLEEIKAKLELTTQECSSLELSKKELQKELSIQNDTCMQKISTAESFFQQWRLSMRLMSSNSSMISEEPVDSGNPVGL